ncbi:MAG: DEAD/DEAH box helicase [Agarilytica sp.]
MSDSPSGFDALGLNPNLLKALKSVGYESPSPIQSESIPPLLEGKDLLGQAQTGTGKTAAFALPLLQQINLRQKSPQVMVLAPTRELAIQVAEAFQRYAHYLSGFHVLPIYGGQGYDSQIRALKRGVQVIVGTPGRVMDHMRKGTLKLDNLKHLVLDEADEMLRMGFIDDVEWVLSQTPEDRQIALFSATMPKEIARVANSYLRDPVHIKIKVSTTTAETISQRYWTVGGMQKLDALTRILECEPFDGMIIFVRTKTATVELAEKLEARGYTAAALNGDISQNVRERTVDRLKKGRIDILVATDVAARGLDVERISHVINYDVPYDTESYVHRIGRTGRAGREGEAILFIARRELRMLRAIEKATGKQIEPMRLPSVADINEQRVIRFKQKISDTLADPETEKNLEFYRKVISDFQQENSSELLDIASAFALLSEGERPLFMEEKPHREKSSRGDKRDDKRGDHRSDKKGERPSRKKDNKQSDVDMESFRIEVGRNDSVTPSNIVGAIANEAGIESQFIGHIKIQDDHSIVDLPAGIPKSVFRSLKKVWVCSKQLDISYANATNRTKNNDKNNDKKSQKKPKTEKASDNKKRSSKKDNSTEKREIRKRPSKAKKSNTKD